MFVFNCICYYGDKRKVEAQLLTIREVGGLLSALAKMKLNTEDEQLNQYIKTLKQCQKLYKKYQKYIVIVAGKQGAIAGETDVFLDYLRLSTHLDLLFVDRFLKRINKDYDTITSMYQIVGYLDALIAINKFRNDLEKNGGYCKPEFCEDAVLFKSEKMYYPLLTNAVKNSLDTNRGILITGSNATGKSTFLRTVAVNAIFAQTIYMVCAASYRACFFKIMTVMNVKDNIFSNDSYYMMEIKSLKHVLDQINTDMPALCCMDEILRGTNTVERIGAASEILNTMAKSNVICLAASHDIELSYILEDIYDNYHFQESVSDDCVDCDYIFYKDRSYTRNAISLLKCIGYSEAIVEQARQNVNEYIETGKWKKYMAIKRLTKG